MFGEGEETNTINPILLLIYNSKWKIYYQTIQLAWTQKNRYYKYQSQVQLQTLQKEYRGNETPVFNLYIPSKKKTIAIYWDIYSTQEAWESYEFPSDTWHEG